MRSFDFLFIFKDVFFPPNFFFFFFKSGAQEEIDYSAKLKFSDDEGEDERDEEEDESKNGILYVSEKY